VYNGVNGDSTWSPQIFTSEDMNLYLAAVYTNNYKKDQARYVKLTDSERAIVDNIPNILESYHYVCSQKFVDTMRQQGAQVFLDSGAFSAFHLGVTINIDDYCDYIIRNRDILRLDNNDVMASVLDGIGDPLKTWQNQLYMEKKGAKPLPCFHFGEDPRYLDWYVQRYEYITIGGLVRKSSNDQRVWLDRIWNDHILDGSGNPRLKVHGFGLTSPELMARYPWHSCDSSSWIQAAAFGSIFTSEYGPIAVSKDSPAKHDAGRHLSNLTEIERNHLNQLLDKKGFNYERLSTVYESRAVYNCLGYIELNGWVNQQHNDNSFKCSVVQELF
jgi:hypothetical protein